MGCAVPGKLCRIEESGDAACDEALLDASDKLSSDYTSTPCAIVRSGVACCGIDKQCYGKQDPIPSYPRLDEGEDVAPIASIIALDTSEIAPVATLPVIADLLEVPPSPKTRPAAKAKKKKRKKGDAKSGSQIGSKRSDRSSASGTDVPSSTELVDSCTASSKSIDLETFQFPPLENLFEVPLQDCTAGETLNPYFYHGPPGAIDHQNISGWLMKKKGKYRPVPLARKCAGSCGHKLFWKRSYFDLGPEYLTYSSTADGAACGAYNLVDIDGILVHGREILLHFVQRQKTGNRKRGRHYLFLRADSASEAECWGDLIRTATALILGTMLPKQWDVKAMLTESGKDGNPFELVSEIELPPAPMMAVQRLLDHAFVCKRTRDRGEHHMPVRLEVVKVVRVQNSAAWIKYSKARMNVKGNQELVPPIITSTHEDRIIPLALGELDLDSNEHWLFHGTSQAGVQGITHRDFRLDLAGTHRGTMYGNGVYLAECSSKADEYTYEEDGLCRMLLCRAVLGRMLIDQTARPQGESLQQQCVQSYDSLCGDRWTAVGTFREFILYNQGQVYPAYIIFYRRVGQAELLQSIGQAAEQKDYQSAARYIAHAAWLGESHPDPVVRYRISMLLAARTQLVVPALIQCLRDERRPLRRMAAAALGKLGTHTTPAVPGLPGANDTNRAVAAAAVPVLAVALKDESADVRELCAVALQQFGSLAALAVPALSAALQDTFPGVREAAAVCLGQLGAFAAPSVPALVVQLNDISIGARQAAAVALGSLCITGGGKQQAASTVVALIDRLGDSSAEVRQAASTALGKIGTPATTEPAITGLKACLEDGEPSVRQASAAALGQLGASASSCVPQLMSCLQDASPLVRSAAATALGCLGPASVSAIHKLKHALTDSDVSVCCAACLALGQISSQPSCASQAATTVQALTRRLRETDSGVRKAAATALGQFGMHAMPALPALTERIKDSSHDVRKAAASALSMLGENAAPALPALNELQNDSNEDVRRVASSAIADINRRLSTTNQGLEGEDVKLASFSFLSYYKFAKPPPDFVDAYQTPTQSEEEYLQEEGAPGVDTVI